MSIKYFDMFSGIGGFRSGLEAVGGFECVGHCEIDEYVNKAYNAIYDTKGEIYFEDAREIDPNKLPNIDLICAGFPCQSFSIAGKRLGFTDDTTGTLFFEIARLAKAKRPSYLLLENVPGLLSHDKGKTFKTIIESLVELGYDIEWCVHNSSNFNLPQQRKRLYIVGYLAKGCVKKVFPLDVSNGENLKELIKGTQGNRVYDIKGTACTQCAGGGGGGGKTGLYFIDLNIEPKLTEEARCITANQNNGISKHKGEHSGVFIEDLPRAILTPNKENVRQQGRRVKEPNEDMFTITVTDKHGVIHEGRIRRLMPIECFRLQGFTDEQFYKAQTVSTYVEREDTREVIDIAVLNEQISKIVHRENTLRAEINVIIAKIEEA